MGQSASSIVATLDLKDASVDVLATAIEGLGPKYHEYAQAVRENAVDGELLDSLDDNTFQETLEDLEVSNRLHQRVLTKEWIKWRQERNRHPPPRQDLHPSPSLDSADTHSKRRTSNKDVARAFAKGHPEWILSHEIIISEQERQELIEAAASYELNEETPDCELEGFDRTACKAYERCHASYGGVHLLEDDGHFVLGARFRSNQDGVEQVRKERIHAPRELSRCYGAIVADDRDWIVEKLAAGKSPFQLSPDEPTWYMARIIHTPDGKRIGVVCIDCDDHRDCEECHAILKELAAEVEEQLRVRKALLNRSEVLRDQIRQLHLSKQVLPTHGPLRAVTQEELNKRGPPPYPMPDEIAASGKPRKTSALPFYKQNLASPEEMSHLPDNYYQAADVFGAEHNPVPKDDMQRIAVLESLGLTELTHDHPTGIALKRLVRLGARLFDVSYAEITFQTHTESYTFARYIYSCTEEQKAMINEFFKPINYDEMGEPWLTAFAMNHRCLNLCNYVLTSKRTMAVHDVWQDETFKWFKEYNGFQFYSGSPIFVNGHVVATLCMMDFRRRPDFSQAQEMQQEQIAMLISQQIESWALRRDVERLENERSGLKATVFKASPPDRHAALVFTDVEGSTSLWEANPCAMNRAIALHDTMMRKGIEKHHGFEVATEGDAFHVAFHDSYDAVCFALKAQMALHHAEWSDDLLALPEACNKGNGFRGLRVRIAIHVGDVVSRDNEVSGRREFIGPTYYIGKSLELMAHGGQILVTSDVWNAVSHVSESVLGSPQVLDLGLHVLLKGRTKQDGIIAKHVLQLVPSELAYDYMQHRSLTSKSAGARETCRYGRCFPPVRSPKRLSSSFHEAPYANNHATMAFVNTMQVEDIFEDPSTILAVLSKRIGILLTNQPGYQCKDFMLVFASTPHAISFGLKLQEYLRDNHVANHNLSGLVQYGLHEGAFSSMGPHKLTGRADYLGVAVNRAARVASATRPGDVCMGICVGDCDGEDALAMEDRVLLMNEGLGVSYLGQERLKGIQEEMALYVCRRA